jgi:hypothetical protein
MMFCRKISHKLLYRGFDKTWGFKKNPRATEKYDTIEELIKDNFVVPRNLLGFPFNPHNIAQDWGVRGN